MMSYEPNFTITNKEYLQKKFEEILIVISEKPLTESKYDKDENLKGFFDLMSVKSLTDDDLKGLFLFLEDYGNLSNFYNRFSFFISKKNSSKYWEKKDKYEIELTTHGYSQIKIVNYFLYFFVCFFDNKNALLKIYEREIYKDDFGIQNQTNWEKKFKSLFENVIIKKIELTTGMSAKDFYKKDTELNVLFKNICDFFIYLSERLKKIDLRDNQTENDETFNTRSEKGISFEKECSIILQKNGWKTEFTPKTGDQGADIIANKGKIKLVVQCKNYEKPVGNDAVQQIISAKSFFDATIAAVVSKSGFTKSSELLAEKTTVLLLSTSDLNEI